MTTTPPWQAIEQAIAASTNRAFHRRSSTPVGGGCIHSAYRIDGDDKSYFAKLNSAECAAMFETETQVLQEMTATRTVTVPQPISHGTSGGTAFLVLEWLPLGSRHAAGHRILGRQLADMHRIAQPYYGWAQDNFIGSTPQRNGPADDWCEFWRTQRLGFQLGLAAQNGFGGRLQSDGDRLCDLVDAFFSSYRPQPALLHGDLWGGNHAVTESGEPVIFDPAGYYGDREADMAMTELFGGFGADFYAAYEEAYPLDAGYPVRKTLYNLYHILNHLNLFGGGYLSQAESMIQRLLAEV
jgi:protein-ribulosamine 3-kinase